MRANSAIQSTKAVMKTLSFLVFLADIQNL
jgi:hypothetical protein